MAKKSPDIRAILSGTGKDSPAPKQQRKEPPQRGKGTERKERTKRTLSDSANTSPASIIREKFTTTLDPATVERVRNAAYWSRNPVAAIVERAILAELERMERANGEPFKPRAAELRQGRPLK